MLCLLAQGRFEPHVSPRDLLVSGWVVEVDLLLFLSALGGCGTPSYPTLNLPSPTRVGDVVGHDGELVREVNPQGNRWTVRGTWVGRKGSAPGSPRGRGSRWTMTLIPVRRNNGLGTSKRRTAVPRELCA